MFAGFIAVIVAIIVIISIYVGYTVTSGKKNHYVAEAQKVNTLLSRIEDETNFYYSGHGSYEGINTKYFKDIGFSSSIFGYGTMPANEWIGLSEDYTGYYIKVGGEAKDNMRIIVRPVQNGKGYVISVIGKDKDGDLRVDNVDPAYTAVLEKVLRTRGDFFGG